MKTSFNFNNRGYTFIIGIIIVLILAIAFSAGVDYYLSKQLPNETVIIKKQIKEIDQSKETAQIEEKSAFSAKEKQSQKKVTPREKNIPEEKPSPKEKVSPSAPIISCENECFPNGSKKCSDNGYRICGDYDKDNCLEWGPIINCPPGTSCQNGNCNILKCSDGTPYGECSSNKPMYCDNGKLVEKASLCGCPSGYDVYGDLCIRKLSKNCVITYEGTKDFSRAINFVIVPADLLYGDYINNPEAQYSNNFEAFIFDAKRNVNDFLSIDPVNEYNNIFNFYSVINATVKCTLVKGTVQCDLWKEVADNCNIPYDAVIILQRKEGGGLWGGLWIQSSAHTTTTFAHEIGHYLGLRDYEDVSLPPGPNHCIDLKCCGGIACQFPHWSEKKPIELGGPECCLYVGTKENTSFYIPNEQSVMHMEIGYKALKFNHLERAYLNELFMQISSRGKESVRCGKFFRTNKYCYINK